MVRQDEPRITQFKQQEVIQTDPEIAIQTGYRILDEQNWENDSLGGGDASATIGGLNQISVDDAEGSRGSLRTTDRGQYIPSYPILWGCAFRADAMITEDQIFQVGVTATPSWDDAYRLRIEGTPAGEDTDYYLQILKGGSVSISRHISIWDSDPRAIGWDETVGSILRSELGWYDFGEWKPEMQIPDLLDDTKNEIIDHTSIEDPNVRRKNIPLDYLSPVAETATDEVNFRIRFELENVGPNASANTVHVGNPHYNIMGQNRQAPRIKPVERNGGGIGGGNITQAQPYPLVAVRADDQEDVPMAPSSITVLPGADGVEITAYNMRKSDVTFVNGADADMGPPPGLDTQNCFFEDAQWDVIDSVTRWDAAGTGNNDPHRGTEGYPVGQKLAGSTVAGGSGGDKVGTASGLDANARLSDLSYLVLFARGTDADNISVNALDYEMQVDR